jgi:hypothetical protein
MSPRQSGTAFLAFVLLALMLALPGGAYAAGLEDEAGAEWLVEQPEPPPPPANVEASKVPIGLGKIGDIAFWEPDQGALTTAGNGSSIPAGVWFYDGAHWRELSTQCGATDGRIAWAGPEEFWTVSDGRQGQAVASSTERPPLEDDTLCHFAPGPSGQLAIVASYAAPAFLASSYQPMHAAGCISSTDCWFAGGPLPAPETGAFQLHWNGHSVEAEPYLPEGHTVWGMEQFEGKLYESVRLLTSDRTATAPAIQPPPLRVINPEGTTPTFQGLSNTSLLTALYSEGEYSYALEYLHLSATGSSLWAAAGPQPTVPAGSEEAGVTVVRKEAGSEAWSQVIGPETTPSGAERFPEDVVDSIAAEPGSSAAWLAVEPSEEAGAPQPLARAHVARVSAEGAVSDEAELPAEGDPHGALGAAKQIVCPAEHDCWMTTQDGWLLHLSTASEREHPDIDQDSVFAGTEPITYRPPDEGIPQEQSDVLPTDTSGLEEQAPLQSSAVAQATPERFARVTEPLLSDIHSRLIHRTTLELSFRLAVKAQVRLLAKRRGKVVASTPKRTLQAGSRKLLLALDPKRWPTKLSLQTHALGPLPTKSTREAGTDTVTTSLSFLDVSAAPNWDSLP